MKKRIYKSMVAISIITIVFSFILIAGVMYHSQYINMQQDVKDNARYISAGFNLSGETYLGELEDNIGTNRITWISKDGTVLYDSEADVKTMENHLNRPEIKEALKNGQGEAVHLSSTLGTQTFYYALLLDDGTVLRVSASTNSVFKSLYNSLPLMLIVSVSILILSLFIAGWLTKKIVTPINNLNLENPLSNEIYDELTPLLSRMSKQNIQIKHQFKELNEKREEFSAITNNMKEGLVVINNKAQIISINKSAIRIFNIEGIDTINKHILNLNRSAALQDAVKAATGGNSHEGILKNKDKVYHILSNPVYENNVVRGAILLIHDMTEQYMAEKIRREFSANVSHELKTPLTSISGYAELIKNGMVKEKDIQLFAQRIYDEADHLITLIDDIINLSRLDEKDIRHEKENIDLMDLSNEIINRLKPKANKKGVNLFIKGDHARISGSRHILEEMIYNLCDNAIKYNNENGKVTVSILDKANMAVFTIEDNGIGIPKKHQSRIFERFYRVDKSHSRETGGTGLGLSIVKHGAEYHNAWIQLESEPGIGTKITITIPKE